MNVQILRNEIRRLKATNKLKFRQLERDTGIDVATISRFASGKQKDLQTATFNKLWARIFSEQSPTPNNPVLASDVHTNKQAENA